MHSGGGAGPFSEQAFQPLIEGLAELAEPDAPVFVLDSDGSAFGWIRYLSYPRRIEWLPAARPDALRGLPFGTSYVILPLARLADDASATLRARSGAVEVERLLVSDGAFALYRVSR